MKSLKSFAIIFALLATATFSCKKDNLNSTIEVTGTIAETGITTYQYGSHTISGDNVFYALRSTDINLDDYIGQVITVTGELIDGYPVDGGPDYLEVTQVD